MVDVTPLLPAGRQVVESYGAGGFRVSGARHEGSVLVLPERTLAWAPVAFEEITLESLLPVADAQPAVELLLVGCGPRLRLLPRALRDALRPRGLVLEPMDTGAAARTYNVLLAEGRAVAAALLAIA